MVKTISYKRLKSPRNRHSWQNFEKNFDPFFSFGRSQLCQGRFFQSISNCKSCYIALVHFKQKKRIFCLSQFSTEKTDAHSGTPKQPKRNTPTGTVSGHQVCLLSVNRINYI